MESGRRPKSQLFNNLNTIDQQSKQSMLSDVRLRQIEHLVDHTLWYSRYHFTKRSMPTSMGVAGLKPTS